MIFLWYWALPVLIVVPFLIAYYVWIQRRRSKFAIRYSSLSLVKDALDKQSKWRRHIPPFLFLLGLTAMLFALARPVSIVTLPKQEGMVILAIDVSGSMRANDLKPSRIEAAKAAAKAFIEKQDPTTRIGIVAFSGTASLVQAPTVDRDAALAAVDRLSLQRATGIGYGILTALDAIFELPDAPPVAAQSVITPVAPTAPTQVLPTPTPVPPGYHVPAIIVLLTDGQNTTGTLPIVAAQKAVERGVRVYTIGVGTLQGVTMQGGFGGQGGPGGGPPGGGGGFRAVLDEKTLKAVAEMTDAEYFHASDEDALIRIYQNLDTQLILRTQRTEITSFFTAGAIALLLIGGTLSLFWFNRLP
ncbi:MAG: VWA domain-containing protein [Chloroflexi bacterium]|nr:VWA domain-containing protein [Chloroflexota bacterium]